MTWEDLLNFTRETILDDVYNDDHPDDNLWSNDELIVHANEADNEVAKRMGVLFDDSVAGLAVYAIAQDARVVALNPKVLWVNDATFGGKPLTRTSRSYLNNRNRNWKTRQGAVPQGYWIENDRVYVDLLLDAEGSVELEVCHLPITPGTVADMATASPEVPEHTHIHMANWIAYRAYQKNDTETLNPNASAVNLGVFTNMVGPAISDRDLYDKRNRNPEAAYMRLRTT